MGIASTITFAIAKKNFSKKNYVFQIYFVTFVAIFFLISIYPYFAVHSYYGNLSKKPQLNGVEWTEVNYPEYKEIVNYLNTNVSGQPVILEAQGDSYSDFNIVSSYT